MRTRIRIGLCIILLAIVMPACESVVDGLNVDPNNPTDAPAELILTSAQIANVTVHEGHTVRVAGMWSGYFTGVDRQYKDIYNYNITGASFNQIWENIFYGVVSQSKLVIKKAETVNNRLVKGIALIVQASALGAATAGWGDIPFSQTSDITTYSNPMFESQIDVYANLQNMLDLAIEELSSGAGTSPGVADIHFGGNAGKWIAVAYTLKARFYLETHQYQLAYEATTTGIQAAENSMVVPHGNNLNSNENFMYAFIARSRAGDLNSAGTLITKLLDPAEGLYRGNAKTDETARFNFLFLTTNPNGIIPNTNTSGVFAQTASYPVVTYEENLLTAAETAVRAVNFETGLAKLNAYRAHMNSGGYISPAFLTGTYTFKYEPYTADDFAPGGLVNVGSLTAEEALLQEILLERYIAFFGHELGFNDLRRTRRETVGVKLIPTTGTSLPERFIYSEAEINSNINAPNPVPDIFTPTPINQ